MSILSLEGVRREIGDLVILDSVSAALARGERVGLVGANGAGKTTLLEIVAGREEADGGRVHVARGTRVALLSQEANLDRHYAGAPTVRAVVRRGAAEVEGMERELAAMEAAGAPAVESAAYAALRERFEAADGYHLDQRVDEALDGLGIPRLRWDAPPSELSGGEQTRVALARHLAGDPDLLLLDEPTNHLDIAAIEWLEASLGRRRGALIVASHDRAFLDGVVGRIWELRDRQLSAFKGDYSAYLLQREAADARVRSVAGSVVGAAAREEELVQRYRSQRKHVKMHEHERRLDRLRAGQVPARRKEARLSLPGARLPDAGTPDPAAPRAALGRGASSRRSGSGASSGRSGSGLARSAEVVVSLDGLVCGYRAAVLVGAPVPVAMVARLEARRGERIGLVGPNGAGKSTLLRTVAGQLPALEGFVRVGRNVMPGYLSQLRAAPPRLLTVLDAMLAASSATPGAARSYLARFLFRGDDVQKPVSELSGGERSRLELALLGVGAVNLLLLDEPTNHLDIPAREALEAFLRESEATLVVVSHDRRLLELVCQRLWVVQPLGLGEPAIVVPFEGGYRDWRAAVADGWTAQAELARRRAGAAMGTTSHAAAARAAVSSAASVSDATVSAAMTARARAIDGAPPRSGPTDPAGSGPAGHAGHSPSRATSDGGPRLSKDAYRRERARIEADLASLGERKMALEAGLVDPVVQSNFVELRRLSSELADVDAALNQAEDAWLTLEERAPA